MATIQTRSVTHQMLHEENMRQEEIQRIEHYKLLESTYEADLQAMCDIETECYTQIKQLEKEISAIYSTIRNAHDSYDLRSKCNIPYDESAYEVSLQTLCDIENACYAEIQPLEEKIKMIESKVINTMKEFNIKYQPLRVSTK
jgi:hypothetical protein